MPKRKRLVVFIGIIVFSVFLLTNFIRQQYVVPIIMYHSVSPDAKLENRLSVSVETFDRQMRFLDRYRYNVVPLEILPDLIKRGKRLPPKSIALTFDDGYKDNYTYAFPILKRYKILATVFVIFNEAGKADRLNWEEIKEMQGSGLITFGSHALGPEPLINIKSEEELKKQIFDSKIKLEEKLTERVTLFSYPEGRFNEHIRQLVIDAGYKSAVATNPGKGYPNNDIFALKRIRISGTASNMFVFWIQTSGFYTFIKERRHK